MVWVSNFVQNRAQCLFFAGEFRAEEFFSVSALFPKDAGPGQPRKRDPSQKGRALAFGGPVLAFQSCCHSRAALLGCLIDASFWTCRGLGARRRAEKSRARQFFE